MTPQVYYLAELGFFVIEMGLLGVIIWQGAILIHNDRERLTMERARHLRDMERIEERAKWREQKRQQVLKKLEPSSSDAPSMESPQPFTTQSESPKDGAAESVADPKAISKPV